MKMLTDRQISELSEWRAQWQPGPSSKSIHTSLQFKSFHEAWGFMTEIGIIAERMNHHPEWTNTHGRVRIGLTTHDADGVTMRDQILAEHIEAALSRRVFTRIE